MLCIDTTLPQECPSLMTHASVPDEQRALLGISDTLIRLSVGIESCQDLIDDLDKALNAAIKGTANQFLPQNDAPCNDEENYWDW